MSDDADTSAPTGVAASLSGLFDATQASADAPELSLCGLDLESAAPLLEHALEAGQPGAWLTIRFDAPQSSGALSLFQPVGRRLRGALRDGRIALCRPLPPAGEAQPASLGFVIRFAGE